MKSLLLFSVGLVVGWEVRAALARQGFKTMADRCNTCRKSLEHLLEPHRYPERSSAEG